MFRFLADTLLATEFDNLSYYHVSRFISTVIGLASDETNKQPGPISLRQFVSEALDLQYRQSRMSQQQLNSDKFSMTGQFSFTKPLWHMKNQKADLYTVFQEHTVNSGRAKKLVGGTEDRLN